MSGSRSEKFSHDLIGYCFPALLWTPLAGIHKHQSPSILNQDCELPEYLVPIHPVESLSDRGGSKRPYGGRNVLGPGLQPTNVLTGLGCSQVSSFRDHVRIRIDGNDFGDEIG
jgi:hypothetical protein